MLIRRATVLVGLVLILVFFNWSVAKKEALLRDGTPLLIELAPVDPRSLIQGDYMRLEYRIARDLSGNNDWPRDGHIVVTAGGDNVATFVRRHEAGTPLAPGEHLLFYRRRGGRIKIGTDAFFFQEGHASRYERAKYGELRVDASGESLLTGLRDEQRRPLGTESPRMGLPGGEQGQP
jgi:uncharacterized membrane-anchored protein